MDGEEDDRQPLYLTALDRLVIRQTIDREWMSHLSPSEYMVVAFARHDETGRPGYSCRRRFSVMGHFELAKGSALFPGWDR